MYCSICGLQLPAIAKFCAHCGPRVEIGSPTSSPQLSTLPISNLLCVNCGHDYEPLDRYCSFCGQAIAKASVAAFAAAPSIPAMGVSAAAVQQQTEIIPGTAPSLLPAPIAPPYAQFVLFIFFSEIMASIIAFDVANDLAREKWNSTLSAVSAALLCILFSVRASRSWGRLESGVSAHEATVYRKKVRSRSIVFGLLFIGAAVTVGTAIGKSGAETKQLVADSEHASQLASDISAARSSAGPTVPAQIEMYKSIDGHVREWSSLLRRVREELDTYDQKFPAQHESTAKVITSIEIGLNRARLLQQQIAIAKEIEPLSSSNQWSAWETRMQPLLIQEDSLERSK